MVKELGGSVTSATKKAEYGQAPINIDLACDLFSGVEDKSIMWMSHGDSINCLPDGFIKLRTPRIHFMQQFQMIKKLFGVQFHPEVVHSEFEMTLIRNFVYNISRCSTDWTTKPF